jgi:hypothetical protein
VGTIGSRRVLLLLLLLIAGLIGAGCGSGSSGGGDSALGSSPSGKDSGYRSCYWKVTTYLTPATLKDHDIRVIGGSVNLTMSQYVDQACGEAGSSESVDSVSSYALDLAYIDQSGF